VFCLFVISVNHASLLLCVLLVAQPLQPPLSNTRTRTHTQTRTHNLFRRDPQGLQLRWMRRRCAAHLAFQTGSYRGLEGAGPSPSPPPHPAVTAGGLSTNAVCCVLCLLGGGVRLPTFLWVADWRLRCASSHRGCWWLKGYSFSSLGWLPFVVMFLPPPQACPFKSAQQVRTAVCVLRNRRQPSSGVFVV
jgi:hypothetical protein